MYGFLSTLEKVLANSELRTGLGAVPFNGPGCPVVFDAQPEDPHDVVDVDPAHPLIALATGPPPLPIGAPGPSLKIGVMILRAPAPGASTMPVRTMARRTPSDSIERETSSHSRQTTARKSLPDGLDSVSSSSPCGP